MAAVIVVRESLKLVHGSGVSFYPLRRVRIVSEALKKLRNPGVVFNISGTVKNSLGVGQSRRIIAYRGGSETIVHASAQSDSAGSFSMVANGNHNDVFKVEVIGVEGENTVCFDHIRPE